MTETSKVQVKVTNTRNHPLVSVFEGNLDFEEVEVNRTDYAIKALVPLEFFIRAATIYAFEKFILSPLLDPIAEKFDWTKGVRKYLKPFQPFNLVVHLKDDNLVIQAPLNTNHHITEKIWETISITLALLKREKLNVSTIRFVADSEGKLSIICYYENRPIYIIDIESAIISEIPYGNETYST